MSTAEESLVERLVRQKSNRAAKDYAPTVKDWFKSEFKRDLPVANIGLSDFHRKVGWEHSRAFDVSLHPDSAEGKRLISYLNSHGIPYLAQMGASSKNGRVTSTGPHIHVGPPSSSMSKRSLVDRLVEQKSSAPSSTNSFAGVSGGASGEQRERIDHPYNVSRILTEATHSPEAEVRSQIRKQVQEERGKLRATARAPVALIELKPFDLFRSEEDIVESQVEQRRQAQERQSSPEMTKLRTEYGAMTGTIPTPMSVPLPTRSVVQSLAKAGGSVLKLAGGATSLGGLTPNKFSEWANARGQIVEEAASLSPLTPTGEEIVRSVPEKVATAIGDTGLSIAQIVLLKKATGLPMGRLLALETAAKTSDQPMSERANAVAKSYAMGKVLERHLSRPASAALFGVPTAIEQGAELVKGHGTLFDALLNVGIQAGTGFALGGRKKSLVERLVAEKEAKAEPAAVETKPLEAAQQPMVNSRIMENVDKPETPRVEPTAEFQYKGEKVTVEPLRALDVQLLQVEGDNPANFVRLVERNELVDKSLLQPLPTKPETTSVEQGQPPVTMEQIRARDASVGRTSGFSAGRVSEAAAATGVEAKQPWEMTLSEYRESLKGQRVERGAKGFRYYNREGQIRADHKAAVEGAMQAGGKGVSAEALKEYPDIAAKYPSASREALGQKGASPPPTETGPLTSESSTTGEAVQNQKPPLSTTSLSEPLTGTKVDITRAERQERGLDPVQQQAYTAIGEAYNVGRAAVEGGSVDPRGLAESVAAQPRPLSKSEIGSLGFDRARLSNARTELNNELNTAIVENRDVSDIQVRLKQVERALDFNDQALEKGGREQSEAFNARKMLVLHDYTLGDVLQRAKAAKGAELTPRERVEYTELQQKYEKVLAQLNETERKTATDSLQRDINRISKSQQRTETKELLDAEFAVLQTQFRQARIESRNVQASGLAGIDPEGKLTALVLRMAQNRIKAGVTKAEQLVDDVYNAIKDSVEGLTADDVRQVLKGLPSQRTARLEKQIGEMEAGTWAKRERPRHEPTEEEFRLIRQRDRLKRDIEGRLRNDAMSAPERFGRRLMDTLGLYRAIQTSVDVSFGLRQGKIGLARHPVLWAKAWREQWKGLSNEKYDRAVYEIENDPDFRHMERFGLELPSVASKRSFDLAARNEEFQTGLAEKIPIVRQSEQMFNLAGDTLRSLWFKHDMKMLRKAGFDPEKDADVFRQSAALINDYTGRTDLQRLVPGKPGKVLHQATPLLNQLTYAIRFWASRLKVLTLPLDPRMYPQIPRTMKLYKSMPRVQRVEAWRTLFSFYGLVSTQLAAASLAGAEIDTNPDSPDFLKARFGKQHFDVSAGVVNHLRFAARMLKRIYEAKSGQPRKGFGNAPGEVAGTYLRSKESPPVSIAHDIFFSRQTKEGYGTDFKGDPVYPFGESGKGAVRRIGTARLLPKPIVLDDAMEAYDEMGWTGVGTTLPFTTLGESVSVYDPNKKKRAAGERRQ